MISNGECCMLTNQIVNSHSCQIELTHEFQMGNDRAPAGTVRSKILCWAERTLHPGTLLGQNMGPNPGNRL